jgi:enoyl-CoA hydratase
MPSTITYEVREGTAFITINRPEKLNALTPDSAQELGVAWLEFKRDDSALAAIITGTGDKAFCVGYEVTPESLALSAARTATVTVPTSHDIWKPTIAAIKGYCLAGGWWIAQECDLRVAAEDAEFGITQVKWGLMPAFTASLSRHLQPGHALELLLVGDRIKARRAFEMGFVNDVVPRDQVMDRAIELARKIGANAPLAVRRAKELFYKGRDMEEKAAVELTWNLFAENEATQDCQEGVRAYLERRRPRYQGR